MWSIWRTALNLEFWTSQVTDKMNFLLSFFNYKVYTISPISIKLEWTLVHEGKFSFFWLKQIKVIFRGSFTQGRVKISIVNKFWMLCPWSGAWVCFLKSYILFFLPFFRLFCFNQQLCASRYYLYGDTFVQNDKEKGKLQK